MTFIRILVAIAAIPLVVIGAQTAIALVVIGAQTYALTRIIRASDVVDRRWPQVSVRETLEYLNGHHWDPDASGRPDDDRFELLFSAPERLP